MLDKQTKVSILQKMLLLRAMDEEQRRLVSAGELAEHHSCFGRESAAVGVCTNLRDDDMITSTHRGIVHSIAKGIDLKLLMSELYGKRSGICKGDGGAFHLFDVEKGILGTYPIVAAGIPVSVGGAIAAKMKKTDRVAVAFFGVGATNTGAFHESVNLASVLEVPVLFVCENDIVGDDYKDMMRTPDVARSRAPAYGIRGVEVDGEDPEAVYETSRDIINQMRSDKLPVILEAKNPMIGISPYRLDPEKQRQMQKMKEEHDQVAKYTKRIINDYVLTPQEVSDLQQQAKREIAEAVKFAQQDVSYELESVTEGMYA